LAHEYPAEVSTTRRLPSIVARVSFAFGRFSGDILVGNFGDGQ
jgi:hypothetical protein